MQIHVKGKRVRILLFADIHGQVSRVSAAAGDLSSADLVLAAGDLTNFGGADKAQRVVEAFTRYNRNFYAVPGNCDLAGVDQYLEEQKMSLHARRVELEEVCLIGVGGSLPCPGHTPFEEPEEFFEGVLKEAYGQGGEKPLILVTHQPAYGVKVDRLMGGGYSGSRGIRAFIERVRPVLAASGHIHEAAGTDRIGPTLLVNPGPFKDGCYAAATLEGGNLTVEFKKV